MSKESAKRWIKISLRTLHLLSVAGAGGGILFGIEKDLWINYWWLALVSGALMMVIDIVSNPVWVVQVRGLVIFLKLILLAFLGQDPVLDRILLIVIIIISAIISHAPGKLRYYSVVHRKSIISKNDSKG
jgi:glucan phosphoethanolaminetransferase (alkaline phosphatase superfamily)